MKFYRIERSEDGQKWALVTVSVRDMNAVVLHAQSFSEQNPTSSYRVVQVVKQETVVTEFKAS